MQSFSITIDKQSLPYIRKVVENQKSEHPEILLGYSFCDLQGNLIRVYFTADIEENMIPQFGFIIGIYMSFEMKKDGKFEALVLVDPK